MLALGLGLAASACSGGDVPSDQGGASSSSSSSGSGGGGAGGGAPDCYMNPQTHVEIINACTDAEKVDKAVNLPLLGSDGKLPPLP
jgi:hypothetical protein